MMFGVPGQNSETGIHAVGILTVRNPPLEDKVSIVKISESTMSEHIGRRRWLD